ncbi:hypothetical protein [uncultured Paludibaculum sp.]|uniref:hypothetical protein n=1 Tax=uncultured Paludibaculum sp. TaxID=1765020 RepID=UPI002AAC1064|nr:hypothetical protein [uncultured Paludibaculum sp.]
MDSKQAQVEKIIFVDGYQEEVLAMPLGPNLYRLEESSMLSDARYHDVIEVERQPNGVLRLVRVVTPSGLKTTTWILQQTVFESERIKLLLDKVVSGGGAWEITFGGVLMVHLPLGEVPLFVKVFSDELTKLSKLRAQDEGVGNGPNTEDRST